jgi:sulfoxide reductase catalytic subunit YedY
MPKAKGNPNRMLVKDKKNWEITENEVTSERLFANRRQIIKSLGFGAAAAALAPVLRISVAEALPEIKIGQRVDHANGEDLNSFEEITTYNNFYEFGTGKEDPANHAHTLQTSPWNVEVTGHAEKVGNFAVEDLVDFNSLEERIYRLRCVEAWSLVVPWLGIPLANILKQFSPTSEAKFVRFETLSDAKQMPGLRSPVLDWPYVEGLRIDEAMNPLTFMAVGIYGKPLLPQNGAPLRLVVPWKYGFKSIKSIVKISFVDKMPKTSWWQQNPSEYGFYSNVNPELDHARWSQANERRIGEFFKRKTLVFNGYGDEVASMYAGMDLQKFF